MKETKHELRRNKCQLERVVQDPLVGEVHQAPDDPAEAHAGVPAEAAAEVLRVNLQELDPESHKACDREGVAAAADPGPVPERAQSAAEVAAAADSPDLPGPGLHRPVVKRHAASSLRIEEAQMNLKGTKN
jgi:hypothetical protein